MPRPREPSVANGHGWTAVHGKNLTFVVQWSIDSNMHSFGR